MDCVLKWMFVSEDTFMELSENVSQPMISVLLGGSSIYLRSHTRRLVSKSRVKETILQNEPVLLPIIAFAFANRH